LSHATTGRVRVGELEHAHVAAVATRPRYLPSRGCVVLRRRDDLDEGVAECIDRVAQAEVADPSVVERNVYAEVLLERRCCPVEVDRSDHCLPKPRKCHVRMLESPGFGLLASLAAHGPATGERARGVPPVPLLVA